MAAAEDRVLQYMAENPGASLVDISNVIVAFGADLNTVADMAGIPRAEAQAAFAPTIQPEEDGLDPIEILNSLTGAGPIIGDIADIFSTPTGTYNPTTGAYESPYVLNVAGEDTSQEAKSAAGDSETAIALGQNVTKKILDPDSVSIGDIGTNIFNVVTGPDSDSSDKTKAFFAITDALNAVIPGIGVAARLIDALGLFGGGGMKATPMTPEERAEYEATTRAELAALGFQEGGEGAGEVLLDAVLQSAGTNVTAEDLAGILGSAGITADDVGPLYTDQGTAADRGLVETLSLLKAFPAAVDVNFEKDVTQTSSGGGGASSDAASSAASSDAASSAASSDSSAASSDSSAASSAAQAAADAAAAAGVTGGESITWEDLYDYSQGEYRPAPTAEEIAAAEAAAAEQKALEDEQGNFVARQIYEAASAETNPALKAALLDEYYQYRGLPIPAEVAAEIERLEAEAKVIADAEAKAKATGDPQPTVFTTDTSGLSDNAENVTLTPGQDITIVDTGTGTTAVDGDTKILTKEEKDAAFNEVLAGVDENTAIADVVAAAVNIYGETADAVVAVADAANSAGVSAEDLANATGTSIEDINKAAEDANVAITNQETAASKAAADKAAADKAAADKAAADKAAADKAIADAAAIAACALSGGIMVNGVCVNVDADDDDDTETPADKAAADKAAADKAAADAAAAAKAACDAAGGNIVNGECVCPTGYSKVNGKCVADGDGDDGDDDGDGACPAGSGKEKDLAGNCVCPEGQVEDANGVCQADGDGDGDGACPAGSGKEKDLAGNCVCPEGQVEDANGVCQGTGTGNCPAGSGKEKDLAGNCVCPEGQVEDANGVCQGTGTGNCTGGRTRDPVTQECVCPSNKPNFNEATQQCEGVGTGGGVCTGGKEKNLAGDCVCPQGTEDVNGQCVGTGSGTCPEGQSRDIFGNCVAPEPETTQAVPNLFGVVQTKPGELVNIESMYNIGDTSIFREGTKTLEQEDPLAFLYSGYAEGGIVQDNDIEELIRYLENTRG